LEEENYINDIPFNTACVTVQCHYLKALKVDFRLKEEPYIDDIPFDTHQAVLQAIYGAAIEEVYNFNEEEYVDDIPLEIYTSSKRNESMQAVLHQNNNN